MQARHFQMRSLTWRWDKTKHQTSGVAWQKFTWVNLLILSEQQCFVWSTRVSQHKMTKHAKNLREAGPPWLCLCTKQTMEKQLIVDKPRWHTCIALRSTTRRSVSDSYSCTTEKERWLEPRDASPSRNTTARIYQSIHIQNFSTATRRLCRRFFKLTQFLTAFPTTRPMVWRVPGSNKKIHENLLQMKWKTNNRSLKRGGWKLQQRAHVQGTA